MNNEYKWCLYCGNSLIIELDDGTEGLVCFSADGFVGKEVIVNDDNSCCNFNK